MLQPKKNSHKEFDNEKKFLGLDNSPPPPHNFSNGPSLSGVRTLIITISPSRSIQLPQYSKLIVFRPFKFRTYQYDDEKKQQKIALLLILPKFGPQKVNRFSQICAQFQLPGSFELYATIFQKASPLGIYLSRFLRRMKACIDEFQPNTANTSKANYFEGFWRITSKTNTKMEITKQ